MRLYYKQCSGPGVDNNQVRAQKLGSGNLGSCVEVVEMVTGIQNGPETYQ